MRRIFDNLEEYLILVLLPFMTIVVLVATFARYTGFFSIFWSEELARYCMVYLGYLGISLAMKRRAHIGVTALTDKITDPLSRRVVLILQTAVILIFCLIISAFLLTIISKQFAIGQQSPALEIPIWVPYAAVPLGMLLLAVRTCQIFLDSWRKLEKG